ncbi:hypothetical protein VaNZ11_001287 [Volvox africanus]|uniref:Protein kinase domain-containing protein n=1 Tax=Volvox africanus TaxID=51714 RepID=A0ABQ5RQ79_9CHLO|nr:hypothetical protein VaNZ11_001287 [Volvox africanus]
MSFVCSLIMLRRLCGNCGRLSTRVPDDCNEDTKFKRPNDHGNAPITCANEAMPSISSPSAAPLVDVDALLREAASVMRPQSDARGHGDLDLLALVPFRTLLSEIQLEERLGSGAGGTTWKCRWRTTIVAIKLMVSTSVDQLRASTREAVCSRIVSHPCVVQCYAINIARLTEQDMDLLATTGFPQIATHVEAGGTNNSQGPLLCLGTSPSVGLGAAAMQSHIQRLDQPQSQSHLGPGSVLAQKGDVPVGLRVQESTRIRSFKSAEAAGAVQTLQQSGQLEICSGTVTGATEPPGMEMVAPRTRIRQEGGVSGMQDATALTMASNASVPPPSPALGNPNEVGDMNDSVLLLLRAAVGAPLSDRLEHTLADSSRDFDTADAQGTRLELPRRQPQQQQLQLSPSLSFAPDHDHGTVSSAAATSDAVGGSVAVADTAGAATVATCGVPAQWPSRSESLLLDLDPGDQTAVFREELLRLGAAPGNFLTTIIMEWCDGGTLHDEFTCRWPQPGRLGLRRSGLASGHLLRGLGPTVGGGGSGSLGDLGLQNCSVASEQLDKLRRAGSGGAGRAVNSGSLLGPAYASESAAVISPDTSPEVLCGRGSCGYASGAVATAGTASPRSMYSTFRSSMPGLFPLSSSALYNTLGGVGATAFRSGQQPHLGHCHSGHCRPSGQLSSVPAISFARLMMLQTTQNQLLKHQPVGGPPSAVGSTGPVPDAAVDAATGGAGNGGANSSSASMWNAATSGRTAVVLRCALEVAQGMSYLHSLNLAHGDLTPKNVLLKSTATSRRGFTCKVSDFGLSNPTNTGDCRPADTSQWGTLVYMAPEVLTGRGTLKQADVYSFGAILWHMCTGRPPHQDLRPAQILVGLATGDLQLTWPDWADPGVARIGKACMDRDPSKRPQFEEIVRFLLGEIATRSRRRRAANRRVCSPSHGSGGGAAAGGLAAAPAMASSPAYSTPAAAAAVSMTDTGQPPFSQWQRSLHPSRIAGGGAATAPPPGDLHPSSSLPPPSPFLVPPQPPQHIHSGAQQLRTLGGCSKSQPRQCRQATHVAAHCCEWQPVVMPLPASGSISRERAAASLVTATAVAGGVATVGIIGGECSSGSNGTAVDTLEE